VEGNRRDPSSAPGCARYEDMKSSALGGASECAQQLSIAPLRGKEVGDDPVRRRHSDSPDLDRKGFDLG
jgi:hypothetical protein